ncbi:MAG: peptide-N-glycosidase F-related protein [Mesonia sp.]|uniref:peptide-N-glycosidase F-related protein n=1 Tax=Mesonia sp. TaxID=1960830 RepID=UPI003F9B61EA
MKKIYPILFFFAISLGFAQTPGDTLTVHAFQDVEIRTDPSVGETLYPEVVDLPTGDFRKIIMSLKFECADGVMCGEWDYINHFYIEKRGDGPVLHYELARFITPYGAYHHSSSGWNHTWYFDLTDFDDLLDGDDVELVYKHTGYESNTDRGWKINVKFDYVYGTPIRKINNVEHIYQDRWSYGNTSYPIEDYAVPVSFTTQASTQEVKIKNIITGHGSDNDGCGEFCEKTRTVKWDGDGIDTSLMWRDDCGMNPEYPQAGTWVFDRAGWCPGADVRYDEIEIANVNPGEHTVDLDFQDYTSPGGDIGNYVVTTYAVEYESPVHTNDVEIMDIVSPSTKDTHKRFNPICGRPSILIRNNGTDPLTSLTIEYGPEGGTMASHTWSGNLAFGKAEEVVLPGLLEFPDGNNTMTFELIDPNGNADGYTADNTSSSTFTPVTVHPYDMRLYFKSNLAAIENEYRIIDMSDNSIVVERTTLANSTVYNDDLNLANGCYQLEITDYGLGGPFNLNKDGIDFWFNDGAGGDQVNDGRGQLRFYDNNDAVEKDFTAIANNIRGGDFGSELTYQFRVEDNLGISETSINQSSLRLKENPTSGIFSFENNNFINGKALTQVFSIDGKMIKQQFVNEQKNFQIDLTAMPAGMYLFSIKTNGMSETIKLIKE